MSLSTMMMLGMMFVGATDVIGRYAFNHPIRGALEFQQIMMGGIALLSLGYTQYLKSHIKIDVITQKYPSFAREAVEIIALMVGTIMFFLIAWQGAKIAIQVAYEGRMLENIRLPLFPFLLFVPLGASVFCFESICQLYERFKKLRS